MNYTYLILAFAGFGLLSTSLSAQNDYLTNKSESVKNFTRIEQTYPVAIVTEPNTTNKPKNVIFLIGDGMGVSQVFSGIVANGEISLRISEILAF